MRYVYLSLFVLVTAAVLLFQNLASVTVTFARMAVTVPVALLVIVVYVLGMLSGGALWSLVRRSYRGAFERR